MWRWLGIVLSAVLIAASVAPYGAFPLAWFCFVPVLLVSSEGAFAQRIRTLLAYSTLAELFIFLWITQTLQLFSNLPDVVAVGVNALFAAVYGLPFLVTFLPVPWMRRRFGVGWVVLLPAWAVVVEWLSARVILFPYAMGTTQFRWLAVAQVAAVTGVWGVSFLLYAVNAAIVEAWDRRDSGWGRAGRPLAAVLGLVGLVAAGGHWRVAAVDAQLEEAPVLRVAQIQSPWTMLERFQLRPSSAFGWWADRTLALRGQEVDLVVWPEGACPYELNEGSTASQLWQLADLVGADLLIGAGTREREADAAAGETQTRVFNSVYGFSRARREAPEASWSSTWTSLREANCDLDAVHVLTLIEVDALVATAPADAPSACLDALTSRAASLAEATKAPSVLRTRLATDAAVWPRLRQETARLADGGLVEVAADVRSKVATWRWREAGCTDGDCRTITVACPPEGACDASPEPLHYDKMVPLPFGEYLPLAETFPILATWIEGPGNFRAGTEPVVFDVAGLRAATPICYEGILGYVCNAFEAPDLLVNVTNDAWFGQSAASALHGMLVTFRAIELGVPVVRSAYSGWSWTADPTGRLRNELPLFQETSRVVEIKQARVPTLYAAAPDAFVVVCAAACLAALWRRR